MKIYFLFGIPLEDVYQKMAEDLNCRYGVSEFCGLLWGKDRLRYLNKINRGKINWTDIEIISEHIRNNMLKSPPDWDYLKKAEEKYGIPNLSLVIYTDRWFNSLPYKKAVKMLEIFLHLVEDSYKKMRPDIVIFDPVADMMSYLHYLVAKEKNIPCYSFDSARIPNRISINSNPYRLWERVDSIFKRKRDRPFTIDERRAAESFLVDFKSGYSKIKIYNTLKNSNLVKSKDLILFFKSCYDWLIDPHNPIPWRPWNMIQQRFIRFIHKGLLKFHNYFDEPVSSEKFVLFPLHYQPEASTLVLAPFYIDQLALIEDIAKCLPLNYKLYVKEHPVNLTRRPATYYNRIRKLWNVRLINPSSDSHVLMKESKAVATISGTMGWEAMLYEKPVITFGSVSYNSFPSVIKAGNYAKKEWPGIFRNTLRNHKSNRELLLKYISAVLEGTFPGIMAPSDINPEILSKENIQNLNDALMKTIN